MVQTKVSWEMFSIFLTEVLMFYFDVQATTIEIIDTIKKPMRPTSSTLLAVWLPPRPLKITTAMRLCLRFVI